ncbi:putative F-box domain-containing protein [Helianthus anomalus]
MAEIPLEIMYDILSRMPVKSLARCRCVSKQWCNYINDSYLETMYAKRAHPMLITFHRFSSFSHPNSPCKLSFLEYKEDTLEMKKKPPAMDATRLTFNLIIEILSPSSLTFNHIHFFGKKATRFYFALGHQNG